MGRHRVSEEFRRVGVVTVARSDYGIYGPLLRRMEESPDFELSLFVTGMHLSHEFGLTVGDIEADGYHVAARVESTLSSDTPQGIAKSMGLTTLGLGEALGRSRLDLLFVLGDRYEMLAAAISAIPYNIPLAHVHGGEATRGVIDDQIRHALTKLSHLHFASTEAYAERIRRMGEEAWRVHAPGALSLDNLNDLELGTVETFLEHYGVDLNEPTLLVTFHPLTLDYRRTTKQTEELFSALKSRPEQIVFTYPNADTAGRQIIERIGCFVDQHPNAVAVKHLGQRDYFTALAHVSAMVGNSSSGIIESGSFGLPVVNVGDRQAGRIRGSNVIDVAPVAEEIQGAIDRAVSSDFREEIARMRNLYGDGTAADTILDLLRRLRGVEQHQLLFKRFE